MDCLRCHIKPSTGILVHLCDECFSQWEAEINANPRSADISPIDNRLKHKKAGGSVPDNIEAAALDLENNGVKITYYPRFEPKINDNQN